MAALDYQVQTRGGDCENARSQRRLSVRVLIAGAGDLGQRCAMLLQDQPAIERLILLKRSPVPAASAHPKTTWHFATFDEIGAQLWPEVDRVIFCATPDARDPASYRRLYVDGLARCFDTCPNASVIFCSSTAVYSSSRWCAGEGLDQTPPWQDEDSSAHAEAFNGEVLLQAEALLRSGDCALRLAGLYSTERDYLRAQAAHASSVLPAPARFVNRIHRDDAASLACALLSQSAPPRIVNGVNQDQRAVAQLWSASREQQKLPPLPLRAPAEFEDQGKRIRSRFYDQPWYRLQYPVTL